jgi:hypothetical protein
VTLPGLVTHPFPIRYAATPAAKPIVVVLDQVRKKSIDLDNDGLSDISHGQLIRDMLTAWLPTHEVRLLEAERSPRAVAKSLAQISGWVDEGQPIKAINLSLTPVEVTLKELSQFSGMNITKRALPELKAALLDWMAKGQESLPGIQGQIVKLKEQIGKIYHTASSISDVGRADRLEARYQKLKAHHQLLKHAWPFMTQLRNLVDKKVGVYVAAGNDGRFNLLSLTPGAVNVGSLNRARQKSGFSTRNGLVGRSALGEYKVHEVRKDGNLTAFAVTEDDALVYPLSRLSDKKLGQSLHSFHAGDEALWELKKAVLYDRPRRIPDSLQQYVIPASVYVSWLGKRAPLLPKSAYVSLRAQTPEVNVYQVDAKGNLYRPKSLMPLIQGTSFATPNCLAEDLRTR